MAATARPHRAAKPLTDLDGAVSAMRFLEVKVATASLMLLLCFTACTSWRTAPLTPELLSRDPGKLRVVRLDRSKVVLAGPQLRGDTLIGTHEGRVVVIPIDSVQQVATRQFSAPRTLGIVGIVVGLLAVTAAFINAITSSN